LVGPCPETLKKELEENGLLNKRVFLTGEIPYIDVASHMRRSHIMVLFSRFENLPCVLLEGFCCGLPAIGTNVGGIPEIINNENGMIVESGNEEELLKTLHTMLDNYSVYDREKIAKEAAAVFSYQAIGKRFAEIYSRIQ
jgi:glycosyltransferase involved in cell wall biosynthesis